MGTWTYGQEDEIRKSGIFENVGRAFGVVGSTFVVISMLTYARIRTHMNAHVRSHTKARIRSHIETHIRTHIRRYIRSGLGPGHSGAYY